MNLVPVFEFKRIQVNRPKRIGREAIVKACLSNNVIYLRPIRCVHCRQDRKSVELWEGFANPPGTGLAQLAPNGVVCCLTTDKYGVPYPVRTTDSQPKPEGR